jgi:hypothetical protein
VTLRKAVPLTLKPFGVTDCIDSTNGVAGSMLALANLCPSMSTRNVWVPRPAAHIQFNPQFITAGGGSGSVVSGGGGSVISGGSGTVVSGGGAFTAAGGGEYLTEIGDIVYGIGRSNRFSGVSEPFMYDLDDNIEVVISGIVPGNLPLSAPTTGDWQPPTIDQIGPYIMFSHPGFRLPNAFGWLDMTGFNDTAATGDLGFSVIPGVWGTMTWGSGLWGAPSAAGGNVIANLKKNGQPFNALLGGWRPGMLISDAQGFIPPNTRIAAVSPDGISIMLTQSTTGMATADNLSVRGGTPQHPLWSTGNLNGTPLFAPPVSIAEFSGRAWYAVNTPETSTTAKTAAVVFSAAGDPLNAPPTTTSNVLTLEDGEPINALSGQSYNNSTVAGGIVQALLVWQRDSGVAQITGDAAFGNLQLNSNYLSSGTLAPMTIQNTPQGTRFMAPDGMRSIQLDGTVSDPIGANGDGVAFPFINAVFPSRMAASYNEDVYRVSATFNNSIDGAPIATVVSAEYWYHNKLGSWTGPHNFPYTAITASQRPAAEHGFLGFPMLASGVWFSNTRPLVGASYNENGSVLTWMYQTSLLPDTGAMAQNEMLETTLSISLPALGVVAAAFINEAQEVLDTINISGFVPVSAPPRTPAGIWGDLVWGQGNWGAGTAGALLAQRRLNWHRNLNFKQGYLVVSGVSDPAVALGNLYMRYQITGYLINDLSLEGQMYPVTIAAWP